MIVTLRVHAPRCHAVKSLWALQIPCLLFGPQIA